MTVFFDDLQPKLQIEEHHNQLAKKLLAIIQTKSNLKRPYSLKAWSKEFARLEKSGAILSRIQKVLDWFEKNIHKPYTPHVYSAKGFRDKFPSMEDAMRRDRNAFTDVQPSQEAQRIADRLRRMKWPKGCEEHLGSIVQIGLDNLSAATKCWKHNRITTHNPIRKRVIDKILSRLPPDYIEQWYRRLRDRLIHWDDWGGDLQPFIFTIHQNDFIQFGREIVSQYGRDPQEFDQLLELINEN